MMMSICMMKLLNHKELGRISRVGTLKGGFHRMAGVSSQHCLSGNVERMTFHSVLQIMCDSVDCRCLHMERRTVMCGR